MKKTLVFILIFFCLVFGLSADANGETLRLSATVENVVYIGITRKAITSSIVPETINNIAFSFNPNTGKWESNEAYIYIISFVKYPLKVTLSSEVTGLKRTKGNSGPEYLQYTGVATAMNEKETHMQTEDITFEGETVVNKTLYTEDGTFEYPRVRSWKFSVVIDPSTYKGTNFIPSGNEYQKKFTLNIYTVS